VCSPWGYFARPDSCACKHCRPGRNVTEQTSGPLAAINPNPCVSREWLRSHPPRAAIGIGSGRDSEWLMQFYQDTSRSPLIINVPISREDSSHVIANVEQFDGMIDLVLSIPEIEKGDNTPLCGPRRPEGTEDVVRSKLCGAMLEKIFSAVDRGISPPQPQKGVRAPCILAMPASIKYTKGQLHFMMIMSKTSKSRAIFRAFHTVFYGRVNQSDDGYEEQLKEQMRKSAFSYEIAGFTPVLDLHQGFCKADGIAIFPLHDRNPRVIYEALQALRPVFVSVEALISPTTACQDFVTTARSVGYKPIAIKMTGTQLAVQVIQRFATWARGLTKWRAKEAYMEHFVRSCLGLRQALDSVWAFIFELFGDTDGLRDAGTNRTTWVCDAPPARSPQCNKEFSCGIKISTAKRYRATSCRSLAAVKADTDPKLIAEYREHQALAASASTPHHRQHTKSAGSGKAAARHRRQP